MPDAKELLNSDLHDVFSERHSERRRAAIQRTYTEDVAFIDPEGEYAGRQALSDQAQKLQSVISRGGNGIQVTRSRSGTTADSAISVDPLNEAHAGR
jgi:hypothetical protein